MSKSKIIFSLVLISILLAGFLYYIFPSEPEYVIPPDDSVQQISQLEELYQKYNIQQTPTDLTVLLFKSEQSAELWLNFNDTAMQQLLTTPFQIENTALGPNLFRDSTHLPEGIYSIQSAMLDNCTTLLLNFPNVYDQDKAKADSRIIQPYKFTLSTCDSASFQLPNEFLNTLQTLLTVVPTQKVQIIIAPNDSRLSNGIFPCTFCPFWVYELYNYLELELRKYPIMING